jgi:hypothetical protein
MTYYITNIKDSIGFNYLGIQIDKQLIESYLDKMRDILGDEFDDYIINQQNRDGGKYHMTVANVSDYNSVIKKMGPKDSAIQFDTILKTPIDDLKFMGLGRASRGENTSYFVVCKSQKLDYIRDHLGIRPHDFHITLGFKYRDVFGVRKNQPIDDESNFTEFIKDKYMERENFLFIKEIENWEEGSDVDINILDINNKFIKVNSNGYVMDIGIDDGGKLRVFTKYPQPKRDMPYLSTSSILSILFDKKLNN